MAYHQKKPGLNRWLSCTQYIKQSKQRNESFKWIIQFLVIVTPSRMQDIEKDLEKTFDIINRKILLKKMCSVGFSATQLLSFLVWVVLLLSSFQVSVKNKFSNVASTNCKVTQQSTGFSLLRESPLLTQNFLISPPGKIPPSRLPAPPPAQPSFYSPPPPKVNFPNKTTTFRL